MKFKHSNSVFWEYVFTCAILALITCVTMGSLLGALYLRSINSHNESLIRDQAGEAAQELEAQLDSMQQLSIRLSTQMIYRADHLFKNKYNVIIAGQSITQYRSYCPMASRFALLYREGEDFLILQQDGTTTSLSLFLSRCQLSNSEPVRHFLFDEQEAGRVMHFPEGILIAYPIRPSASGADSTLCFVVYNADLQERVRLSGALEEDSYRLSYKGMELTKLTGSEKTISVGSTDAFRIDAAVPRHTVLSLITSPQDILLLSGCLLLLFICIFLLAWRCYRPIRFLSRKYSGDTGADI